MLQGSAPCSGHVLPANKKTLRRLGYTPGQLANHINTELTSPVYEKLNAKDLDVLFNTAHENDVTIPVLAEKDGQHGLDNGKIVNVEVYRYQSFNGDIYDELSEGYYFVFNQTDLYTMLPTKFMKSLLIQGCIPESKQWTNFG